MSAFAGKGDIAEGMDVVSAFDPKQTSMALHYVEVSCGANMMRSKTVVVKFKLSCAFVLAQSEVDS